MGREYQLLEPIADGGALPGHHLLRGDHPTRIAADGPGGLDAAHHAGVEYHGLELRTAVRQCGAQRVQGHGVAPEQLVDEQALLAAQAVVPQHQRVFLRRVVFDAPADEIAQRLRIGHAGQGLRVLQHEGARLILKADPVRHIEAPALQRAGIDLHAQVPVRGVPFPAAAGLDHHVHGPGGRVRRLRGRLLQEQTVHGGIAGAVRDLLQVARGVAVPALQVAAAQVEHHRPLGGVLPLRRRGARERQRGEQDEQYRRKVHSLHGLLRTHRREKRPGGALRGLWPLSDMIF